MSSFACNVVRVEIEPHPNADAIEIALVGGYRSIVKKGQFETGDLAIYIPEDSVLPEWLLKLMGFWDDMNGKGKLSNSAGNRVRAMKLRGVVSQGLLLGFARDPKGDYWLPSPGEHPELGIDYDRTKFEPKEGDDFAEYLEIKKYEVHIPQHLAGKLARGGGDLEACALYDFDNIKKWPSVFIEEERVVITEKLHGTQFQCGLIPQRLWEGKAWADLAPTFKMTDGSMFKATVTSKGLSKQGLLLDPTDMTNLYTKTAVEWELWSSLKEIHAQIGMLDEPIFIFGEIYGGGVQQGYNYGVQIPQFRAFDLAIGGRHDLKFFPAELFWDICDHHGIPTVPILFDGKFSHEVVKQHTDGQTVVNGGNIREGVVIKCANEIRDRRYGRRIVKSISDAYLLAKNGTDYQ